MICKRCGVLFVPNSVTENCVICGYSWDYDPIKQAEIELIKAQAKNWQTYQTVVLPDKIFEEE